jgi:hypothetical protein
VLNVTRDYNDGSATVSQVRNRTLGWNFDVDVNWDAMPNLTVIKLF